MTHITDRTFNRWLAATAALLIVVPAHSAFAQRAGTTAPAFSSPDINHVTMMSDASPAADAGIEGTVLDPSGAAVTGAELTIRNIASDQVQRGVSDAFGAFTVENLPPGSYEVTAAKAGLRGAKDERHRRVDGAPEAPHADLRLTIAAVAADAAAASDVALPRALEALETHVEQLEAELAALKAHVSEADAGHGRGNPAAVRCGTP